MNETTKRGPASRKTAYSRKKREHENSHMAENRKEIRKTQKVRGENSTEPMRSLRIQLQAVYGHRSFFWITSMRGRRQCDEVRDDTRQRATVGDFSRRQNKSLVYGCWSSKNLQRRPSSCSDDRWLTGTMQCGID